MKYFFPFEHISLFPISSLRHLPMRLQAEGEPATHLVPLPPLQQQLAISPNSLGV